jgi:leucine efflux protein
MNEFMNIDWLGFCMASIAIVLAPGPGSLFMVKTAAATHTRERHAAMLGIMAGDTCLIALSLCGASTLLIAHPSLFDVIRFAGALYLIFLGLQSIFAIQKNESKISPNNRLFRQAISITLLNPKAVFFFMAFFPVFIRSAETGLVAPYAVMTLIYMAISGTYLLFLINASSRITLAFKQNRLIRWVGQKLCGCIFIGFGLKVALAAK